MESVHLTCHTDRTEIVLKGMLDVGETRAAHGKLAEALTRALPLELRASEMERVDTAGLQLLIVFLRAAHERGLQVRWGDPGAALAASAQLLGLGEALELPQ
jgi:ABC-type transporter Mla MlaB component